MIPRPRPEPIPGEQLAIGDSAETGSERRRLELPDGSIVYLNANTSVTLVAPRQLELDRGEIYVEVAPAYHPAEPDAESPRAKDRQFYVVTPDREITALGTKFDVRLSGAGTGLALSDRLLCA